MESGSYVVRLSKAGDSPEAMTMEAFAIVNAGKKGAHAYTLGIERPR